LRCCPHGVEHGFFGRVHRRLEKRVEVPPLDLLVTRSRERDENLAAAVMRYGARACEPEARAPSNPLQRGRAQRGVRGNHGDAAPRGIGPSPARHELADRNPRDAEPPPPAEVREDEHAHHLAAGKTTRRSDPPLPPAAAYAPAR